MKHTPLPWFVDKSENGDLPNGTLIIAGDEKYRQADLECTGNVICAVAPPHRTTEIDMRNAEFIVEACNSYYKLRNSRANWKQCSKVQHEDIKRLLTEIDRLRKLLRSMPKSFGITERDINGR